MITLKTPEDLLALERQTFVCLYLIAVALGAFILYHAVQCAITSWHVGKIKAEENRRAAYRREQERLDRWERARYDAVFVSALRAGINASKRK